MTASVKPAGKRSIQPRKLNRDPGKSALQEKIGENQGRTTERAAHKTQNRLKRVQPFKAGMASS